MSSTQDAPHEDLQMEPTIGFDADDLTMCICPVCGFSAKTTSKLDEHIESAHGDETGAGRCLAIGSSTPKSAIHRRHTSVDLRGVDEDRYFSDSNVSSQNSPSRLESMEEVSLRLLGSTFTQAIDRVSSQQLTHQQQNASLQADSRRRYRCSMCAATFPWHGDLTDHLKEAHGVWKNCRETSRRASNTGSESAAGSVAGVSGASVGRAAGAFFCGNCKYVAKYQSELRRHMRLHSGVKPFTCVFCVYRSAWKGDLKRHMESHHKECFASETELVRIMAQFKNNAGTATVVGAGDSSPKSIVDSPVTTPKHSPISNNFLDKGSHYNSPFTREYNSRENPGGQPTSHWNADTITQFPVYSHILFGQGVVNQLSQPLDRKPLLANHGLPPPLGLFSSTDQYTNLIGQATSMLTADPLLYQTEMMKVLLGQAPEQLADLLVSQEHLPKPEWNPPATEEPLNLVCKQEIASLEAFEEPSTTSLLEVKPPPAKRRSIAPSPATTVPVTSSYIGSGAGLREEQWKRYQCSGCGHRSNWKWDINKHIKVAHPERTEITTITMDLEEARLTFTAYLEKLKTLGRNGRSSLTGPSGSEEWGSSPVSSIVSGQQPTEGYYRPFKCTVCGHRSNWKWDVKKHIKQMHAGEADVMTLSNEEARRTINQYKSHRRQSQSNGARYHWSVANSSDSSILHPLDSTVPQQQQQTENLHADDGMKTNADQPSSNIQSAFRCTICKRRFQTWTNLQQHALFGHGSGEKPLVSNNAAASANAGCKRSYKKALLLKALASPSAIQRSPVRGSQPPVTSKSPAMKRLPFTEKIPPVDAHPRIQARRTLFPPTHPIPNSGPLRSCTNTNVLSSTNADSKVIQQKSNKVFQLTELLQQVLHFLVSSSTDEESTPKAITKVKFSSDDTSEEVPSLTGTSSDENENEPSTSSGKSDRLARLLLQPQVQPLVNQLSSLFHMAMLNSTLTNSDTTHSTQ